MRHADPIIELLKEIRTLIHDVKVGILELNITAKNTQILQMQTIELLTGGDDQEQAELNPFETL